MFIKNSHCTYCGTAFKNQVAFPRTCEHCSQITYQNPIPVSVVLLPVDHGLLVIRRGIEPGKGKLALPGGYVESHESWQEAGARELYEETQITIDPNELKIFEVVSVPGSVLIFSIAEKKEEKKLSAFISNEEIWERKIISQPEELVFPAHTKMVKQFFK